MTQLTPNSGFRRFALPLAAIAVSVFFATRAESAGKFVSRVYQDAAGEHKYVVFVPAEYSSSKTKRWPVILYLHGAGNRGNDGLRPSRSGIGAVLKQRSEAFPFLVVFPQSEDRKGRLLTGWNAEKADAKRALKILAAVEKTYRIDPARRILTGWSMGGYGVWSIAAATPKLWAGIVPVSGGGDAKTAFKLKNLPIWAFHGEADRLIRPSKSEEIVAAVRKAGGTAELTIVKNGGHDVWKTVYANAKLIAWMQNPTRNVPPTGELLVRPGRQRVKDPDESAPFVPAVEIPRAVFIRLGNEALKTLAYSVPSKVPRTMLTGKLEDIHDTTVESGRTFNVQFSGIRYTGSVERAAIQGIGKNKLRVQLGLRNVTMSIARTYVTGRSRSAVAGRIDVVLGHLRPVWLTVDVAPYVQKRKLKFKLLYRHFSIPDDNWYVTSPAGVSTRGLGMTREKVSRGLVNGLYGSKERIEREVLAMVPKIVKSLEEKLEVTDASHIVAGFWPLPVYRPRVRFWPESIATDKDGITVLLGMTAAAVDPKKAPRALRKVAPLGPPVEQLPKGTGMRVGVAPGMLGHLTQLLIDADVARIHVRDIPEKKFAALADVKLLAEAIPDLKRYGDKVEIWSELILGQPLTITGSTVKRSLKKNTSKKKEEFKPDAPRLTFTVRDVVISLAIRNPAKSDAWTPYAEFRFGISQQASVSVLRPDFTTRKLSMDWTGKPRMTVSGRFSPKYRPENPEIDTEKIRRLFADAWNAWTKSGPAARADVPDLEFGISSLRLDSVGWSDPFLSFTLASPGLKITNSTNKPLVYQAKGPHSGWSSPLTIPPNDSHEFEISHEMLYRSTAGGRTLLFTLPAGSHSVYRAPRGGGPPRLFKARSAPPAKKKE